MKALKRIFLVLGLLALFLFISVSIGIAQIVDTNQFNPSQVSGYWIGLGNLILIIIAAIEVFLRLYPSNKYRSILVWVIKILDILPNRATGGGKYKLKSTLKQKNQNPLTVVE
jgi:uncharacterized BrkB/YihY/UPF0761 family membrane protein